jgi:hypothetical protein
MKKHLCLKLNIICLILIVISPCPAIMAASNDHDSTIIKNCKDFRITGDGLADAWKTTNWITLIQQGEKVSPLQTRTKILYSETGIYFLFNCEDKKLTSSMKADNLNLWEEDVVEVFLWTDEKFPVYFEYELSPFNYELPIMVPNNNGNFLGWLPWHYDGERKIQHATSVNGGKLVNGATISGWMAEFFIPYKLLTPLGNVPPKPGTRWRANMYRIDYDDGLLSYSWQITEKTFHEYNKFGIFIFE